MRWLLGATAIFGVIFAAWYLSIEHTDPVTLTLEQELDRAVAACIEAQQELVTAAEIGSGPASLAETEPASPCWQTVDSLLADVTFLFDVDLKKAGRQLESWGWAPAASMATEHLPDLTSAGLSRTFFDRRLGPSRDWWDPRPTYGCTRYYQVAVDVADGGSIVKAHAYQATGFTICS